MGDGDQESYLLEAFKHQASLPDDFSRDVTFGKLDCPELSRDALMQDSGRGIMNLLKLFLLDDNDEPPRKPFVLPNPRYDAIIGWTEGNTETCRMWGPMVRTQYICMLFSSIETVSKLSAWQATFSKFL